MTAAAPRRIPVFAALATSVVLAEWFVVHSAVFSRETLLPFAVFFDLAVFVPFLFWLLVLRPAKRGLLEAAPVFAVAVLVAGALLAAQPETKNLLLIVGGISEGAVIWLLTRRVRAAAKQLKGRESDDLLMRLEVLTDPLLRALGIELAVFYYAFVGPRLRRPLQSNEFSYTEKSGLAGLLFGLGFVTVVEGFLVHVLLRQWTPKAAWIFTALHLYGLVWLTAAYQAARLRPVVVEEERLLLRTSLLWTAEIPRALLASVTPIKQRPPDKTVLRAAFGDDPKLLLTLHEPLAVRGLLGMRKTVTQIALYVDEPDTLRRLLTL